MLIVSDLQNVPLAAQDAVLALGNFDGLHKGHQVVLKAAQEKAKALGKKFGLMSFEPHPRSIFCPNDPPYRITPRAIKRHLLEKMGIELLLEVPFTHEFSQISAQDFIEKLLLEKCRIAHAVAGHDFVFGHKRGGDIEFLRNVLAKHSVGVTEVTPQGDAGNILWSSTRVREHLQQGEVRQAAEILGRNWSVEGAVQKGDGRGGPLGFPTCNLDLGDYIRPRFGVYAVAVQVGGTLYKAVANIGTRPTVNGKTEMLEVHIFDFSGDLYGQEISVNFIDFIRPEQRFEGLEALKNQIAKDCIAARTILK